MPVPIQATTQEHLDIEDIAENLILLKDGSAALVITTTAVNFGLLSESEQDATIYAYAALLNSLTFPIQILIRSSRKDISGYEKLLAEQEMRTPNPENKQRIKKYLEFIQETVRQRNVLDKKFYIVIPFSVLELGIAKSATAITKKPSHGLPFPKDYIIKRAKMTLEPKYDHLVHQLARLGLRARQLTTKELIQLMFEIYNPDSAAGQILAAPEEYETPLVKPAVAFQESPEITGPEEVKPSGPQPPIPKASEKPAPQDQPPSQISQSTKPAAPPKAPTPSIQPIPKKDFKPPSSPEKTAIQTTTQVSPPQQATRLKEPSQEKSTTVPDQKAQAAINAAVGGKIDTNQPNQKSPKP
jgi:hypothetical protein